MKSRTSNSPKQVIQSRDDKFTFGKHKDQTVQWVLDEDPGYILWACQEGIISCSKDIYREAEEKDIEQRFDEAMDGELKGMRFWDIYNDD